MLQGSIIRYGNTYVKFKTDSVRGKTTTVPTRAVPNELWVCAEDRREKRTSIMLDANSTVWYMPDLCVPTCCCRITMDRYLRKSRIGKTTPFMLTTAPVQIA